MDNIKIIEAYSRLKSLRENIPTHKVPNKFVTEFHSILDLLEQKSGANLENFRIPADEVRPVLSSLNYLTKEKKYSKEHYCDHSFFKMKVEAVLMMFDMLISSSSGSKPPIGFSPKIK